MEVELVHKVFELTLPLLDVLGVIAVELHWLVVGTDEADTRGGAKEFFLGFVLGPDDLEDGVKSDHEAAFCGLVVDGMVEGSFGS